MSNFLEAEIPTFFEFIRNGMNLQQTKEPNGLPITRIETIWNGDIDYSRVGYAGLEKRDAEKWLLKDGDILFSHINSVEHIAKCALFRGNVELVHGMNLLCFRPRRELLMPEYAKWLFKAPEFKTLLMPFVNKAVNQASISIGNISSIKIRIPPLDEQKRIAAILDQADALRRLRQRSLDRLGTLSQAIFYEMFGDLSTNSKSWPCALTQDILIDVTNGLTRRHKDSDVGHDIVLRLKDIRDGWIDFSEPSRITLSDKESRKYRVKTGDLLFIRVNGNPDYVGRCAVFGDHSEPAYFNDHVMRVRIDQGKILPLFLAFILSSPHGKSEIAQHRKTSAGQHTINQEGLGAVKIVLPSLEVQQKFVAHISSIDEKITHEENALTLLTRLFASLQHRAFRGEL